MSAWTIRSFSGPTGSILSILSGSKTSNPGLNGGLLVKLKGGNKIEVSRRQAIKFKEMLSL